MRGLGALIRADWRRRWVSHLLLAALALLTAAVVVAALTAAGRSRSAFDRLSREAPVADAVLIPEEDATTEQLAELAAAAADIEGATRAEVQAQMFVRPAGTEYFPDYDLLPLASLGAQGENELNRSVVVEGRPLDQETVDEVVISEALAEAEDLAVGDRMQLESVTEEWIQTAYTGGDPGPPDGPLVDVEIVGLSRSPLDFGRYRARIELSSAFFERYSSEMSSYQGVHLTITPEGAAAAEAAGVDSVLGDTVPIGEASQYGPPPDIADSGLDAIAVALQLMALTAAVGGGFAFAVLASASARQALKDREVLVGLGCTRSAVARAGVAALAPAAIVGLVLGCAVGVVVSPYAVVGLAGRIDPASGEVLVDGPVLGAALVLGAAVLLGLLALVSVGAARAQVARTRRSSWLSPLYRPLPGALGVDPISSGSTGGGGRTSRVALAALAAGVALSVGALTVSASAQELFDDPRLYGASDGRVIDSGESTEVLDQVVPVLEPDGRVASLAVSHTTFGISLEGEEVTTMVFDVLRGDLGVQALAGELPARPDEVAFGPATLETQDLELGDTVELEGPEGTGSYEVVGTVLFPEGDFAYDEGLALTADGAEPLIGDPATGADIHQVLYDWDSAVDGDAADRALAADLGLPPSFNVLEGARPGAVANLSEVRSLPQYLVVFLGLLCLALVAHAVAVAGRSRRHELATLRALGLRPRSAGAVLVFQAACIAVAGLAIGIPLGLVLGAQTWDVIAGGIDVIIRVETPWSQVAGLTAVLAGAFAAAALVAAWRASRARPGPALHTE